MTELKIVMQKDINCYLHNASLLCVILYYKNLHPWFYENYVQLYHSPQKTVRHTQITEFWLDFYAGWTAPMKLMDFVEYDRQYFDNTDIISFIEYNINKGIYIFTYIDEFYTIHKYHFVHDIFIYGYDKKNEDVLVLGFDNTLKFIKYRINYKVFRESFILGMDHSSQYDKGERYGIGFKLKYDENYEYAFNKAVFLGNLHDYIFSVNSSLKDSEDDPYNIVYKLKNNVYGFEVNVPVLCYLKTMLSEKNLIDHRILHTLYEHKHAVMTRLKFLDNGSGNKQFHVLLSEYQKLVGIFDNIRLLSIKYNISRNLKTLDQLINLYELQINNENGLLNKIYDSIC